MNSKEPVNRKIVAIVQARMGSTRLPGKVLKDLAGDTVLARVVSRTRRASLVDKVLVATSVLQADDAIVRECERIGVECFRGDEVDVLSRYYHAAVQFSADLIVRVTSDCPLIDAGLIDTAVRACIEQEADYATNALEVTFPPGLDVEVFEFQALARAEKNAAQSYQRAHVTAYIYENPGLFKIASLRADKDYSRFRWTLDTEDDLAMLRAVYRHFRGDDSMRWDEVMQFLESAPEIVEINSMVQQKSLCEG